jgi:hypothetical protein
MENPHIFDNWVSIVGGRSSAMNKWRNFAGGYPGSRPHFILIISNELFMPDIWA